MPIDFPSSPTTNQIYTYGNRQWKFNGTAWMLNTGILPTGYTGSIGYTGSQGGTGYTGSQGVITNTFAFDISTFAYYSTGTYSGLVSTETEGPTTRTNFAYDSNKRVTSYTETTGGVAKTVTITYATTGGVSTITVV